jgi:cell division protease FtsH
VVFGETSTTAEDDVARATVQAREMAGVYGMSAPLGPVRLLRRSGGYLGTDDPVLDLVSGPTMAQFDVEVRRLVLAGQGRAANVLTAQRTRLEDMARALIDHETLEGDQLQAFLLDARAAAAAAATNVPPTTQPKKRAPAKKAAKRQPTAKAPPTDKASPTAKQPAAKPAGPEV